MQGVVILCHTRKPVVSVECGGWFMECSVVCCSSSCISDSSRWTDYDCWVCLQCLWTLQMPPLTEITRDVPSSPAQATSVCNVCSHQDVYLTSVILNKHLAPTCSLSKHSRFWASFIRMKMWDDHDRFSVTLIPMKRALQLHVLHNLWNSYYNFLYCLKNPIKCILKRCESSAAYHWLAD